MSSQLVLHTGGRLATRDEVMAVEAPPATDTWFPEPHRNLLTTVEELLHNAGYQVKNEKFGLSNNGARFFGVLDLDSEVAEGVGMVLGLRNSIDKSFPWGAAGGTRTFVCDNLALTGDWESLSITRKHTRNGRDRFVEALSTGVKSLETYRAIEAKRIDFMRETAVSDDQAYATAARAFEAGLINHVALRAGLGEWREPSHDWGDKTLYRLYNALNFPLQGSEIRNPNRFARQTTSLLGLIAPLGGDGAALAKHNAEVDGELAAFRAEMERQRENDRADDLLYN